MLISKTWLRKYIPDIDLVEDEKIASKLTSTLAEVEAIIKVGQELDKLVAGKVLSVEKHPQADKLNLTQVDVGHTTLPIVCGATNVKVDEMVVVCLEGGRVINAKTNQPMSVSKTEIRGVESQGMICSERELGISDQHEGILILPASYKPGDEIDALLKDTIFEIENKSLTHRGDCFSHLGLARELAAIFDLEFVAPNQPEDPIQTETKPLEIRVETSKCSQFLAITMTNVSVADSPFWLKHVLKSIGVRSINNVVDISNYVLHDLGQPVHIYDYSQINDNKLIVREARTGESFSALDNNKYSLNAADLVVSDNKQIHGLAGIIGGKTSEVTSQTTDIIIEVALFDSTAILKSSRQHGISSDAAVRFSKGTDPEILEAVIKTVSHLVGDLAGAEVGSEILKIGTELPPRRQLDFNLQAVKRLSGETIETEAMLVYLERLGLSILNRQQIKTAEPIITAPRIATVEIPSRRRDLREPVDLIEEIVRLHGYDKLTPVYPIHELKATPLNPVTKINRKLRKLLLRLGLDEMQNYSFISNNTKELLNLKERQLLKITNAISPELNYVRNSLVASLFQTYQHNAHITPTFKAFELGRIVDNYEYTEEQIPQQPWKLGLMLAAEYDKQASAEGQGLKELKQILTELLIGLNLQVADISWREYLPQDNLFLEDTLHPYRRASLVVAGNTLGVIGEISPLISDQVATSQTRLIVAELDVKALLLLNETTAFEFEEISRQPQQIRDLSLWVAEDIAIGDLIAQLRTEINTSQADFQTSKISVIDEYREENRQSITIRLQIQPLESTLTKEQVNTSLTPIFARVAKTYRAEIRKN